jgi:T-complex protein 1 subunit beta
MILAITIANHILNFLFKKALAIEAYARALRQLPTIIADNGGYDAPELV